MAEADELMTDEQRPHYPHKDNSEKAEKHSKDYHGDSLQKLIQKAALHSQHNLGWHHSVARTAPQNLFLEGFRDCASEVIRFLTSEESMDDNNPLLVGLQSHLVNVSNTFCHETVSHSDHRQGAVIEQHKYDGPNSANGSNAPNTNEHSHSSPFSPCLISPIFSRSAKSSFSDTSAVESDFSMSASSGFEKCHMPLSSEANFSLHNTAEIHDDSIMDSCKSDDVFHTSDTHQQEVTSCYVLPLRILSAKALHRENQPGYSVIQESSLLGSHPAYGTFEESSNGNNLRHDPKKELSEMNISSLSSIEHYICESWNPAESIPCHPFLNHSSPLPNPSLTHSPVFSAHPCQLSQCLCSISTPEDPVKIISRSESQLSKLSTANESENSKTYLSGVQLSHQLNHFHQGQEHADNRGFQQSSSASSDAPHGLPEIYQQANSLLELKTNLLPSIETASLTSGNFADILLAVESCRFHDDPRVRSLAEELVHLIHNDDFQDEDDFDDNDDDEYLENVDDVNDAESGIEMLDESSDWASGVDMIEQ